MDVLGPERNLLRRVESSDAAPELPAGTGVSDSDHPEAAIQSMVPAIVQLRTEARSDTLFVRGQLRPRDRYYSPFYDPSRIGGCHAR